MITYFETTTLILSWCSLLSVFWAILVFAYAAHRDTRLRELRRNRMAFIPALVLGPLALIGAFRWLGVSLLFPIQFLASFSNLLQAALVPALVLLISSGLLASLTRLILYEFTLFRPKPFVTLALALGQSLRQSLGRLVILKALAESWSRSLPWLFGELVVVECVFNAPGLGLDAWNAAKMRDPGRVLQSLAWLTALYAFWAAVAWLLSRWLGKRLTSYG